MWIESFRALPFRVNGSYKARGARPQESPGFFSLGRLGSLRLAFQALDSDRRASSHEAMAKAPFLLNKACCKKPGG